MRFASAFRMALRALARNKLRTMLTMLGIMIGIGAVICTVAIGEGGQDMIRDQMTSLGTNLVWIASGGRKVNGVRTGADSTKTLTTGDAAAIRREVPLITGISPTVDGNVQVAYGNQNWYTRYRGVAPAYLQIRRWDLAEGSVFSQRDVNRDADVCVLGQTVASILFRHEDPIGKTMRVGSVPCLVIGTLAAKGLSTSGHDQDDFVILPYTTVMRKIKGTNWLDDIYSSALSPQQIAPAEAEIVRLLRERHKLRADEPNDFDVRHPEDALEAQEQSNRTFALMLASIASVSLLVGGIGIMNIMLVSVTERTREIGLRMAIGATDEDVRLQFLIEALALSLLGGAAGVIFGLFASAGVSQLLDWPAAISPMVVIIAAAFSALIGILFGYYPAQKASQLDPIEALRYE